MPYYSVPAHTSIFKIREAWIEKTWKYEVNYGSSEKKETGGYQLNLILDSFINPKFKNDEYILSWLMEDSTNGYFGTSSGVYTLFLKQQYLPDTFKITIEQIDESRTRKKVEDFNVIKK